MQVCMLDRFVDAVFADQRKRTSMQTCALNCKVRKPTHVKMPAYLRLLLEETFQRSYKYTYLLQFVDEHDIAIRIFATLHLAWRDYRHFSGEIANPDSEKYHLHKSLEQHVRNHWDIDNAYVLQYSCMFQTLDVARLCSVAREEINHLIGASAVGSNCHRWLVRLFDHLCDLGQRFIDLATLYDTTHVVSTHRDALEISLVTCQSPPDWKEHEMREGPWAASSRTRTRPTLSD